MLDDNDAINNVAKQGEGTNVFMRGFLRICRVYAGMSSVADPRELLEKGNRVAKKVERDYLRYGRKIEKKL